MQVHSCFSDGEDSPVEILDKAVALGLSGLSLTDHDTVAAYTPEFFTLAEQLKIDILMGIELSGTYKGSQIDVLGYGMQIHHPAFIHLLEEHQRARHAKNLIILEKLKARKMVIAPEELFLMGKGSIGRPHIAVLMMEKGYVKSFDEAFGLWIGDGKPCYEAGEAFELGNVLDVLHAASGIVVLAHPHILSDIKRVRALLDTYPFDGVEVFYGRRARPQCAPFEKMADERGLLKTAGSDYHGARRLGISLGCSWASEEMWRAVKTRLSSHPILPPEKGRNPQTS